MTFLFPGFLFALISIAIPIIIHLFNFRKFKKVYFSNVSFLKEIQQQTSSSRNLKNLLLLITRILALVFLVLAFARPFIPDNSKEGSAFQRRAISVYIDNSYSMETLNKEGTLLDEAKRRAKEIASAYHINDKFQLLTNDFEGKHQRLMSYEDFVEAVGDVKISSLSRSLQQVLNRQQDVFSTEPNTNKTVFFLSDFQKNMAESSPLKIDSAVTVRFVRLEANALPNISVDSVWFASPVHRPGEPERLIVQLKNNSDKLAQNIPVKVFIDGKPKALGSLNVDARSTSKDTLSFSGLTPGWKRGEVSITDYPVVFDDNFFFTFNVKQNMPVLAVNMQADNPYINALYRSEPFFDFSSVSVGNINYSELSNHPLLILTGTEEISPALASQFKTYAENGGTLMIFPTIQQDLSGLRTLTQTLGTDIPRTINSEEAKVSAINLQHLLFKGVFSQVPNRLDLPVATKWVEYSKSSRSGRKNILEFKGGNVFLSEYPLGKGKVYLFAVALDEASSNLVKHSIFVPLMYQSAFLSLRDNKLFYTIGQDFFLESNRITLTANQSVKLKKGSVEIIPDIRSSASGTRLFIADQIKEDGVYQLQKGDSGLWLFAFNDNRLESDLSYLSESDLKKQAPSNRLEIFNPQKGSMQNAIKAANNGVQLWKLCLILALVFLALEIVVARFYKTRESKFAS